MVEMVIFFLVTSIVVAVLLKIFPPLMKVKWKFIAALFVISRILDISSTFLLIRKWGIGTETGPMVIKLYHWLGYGNTFFFTLLLTGVLLTLLIAWLVKILIKYSLTLISEKHFFGYLGHFCYWFGYVFIYALTVTSFWAAIGNYHIYFSLIK